MMQMMLRKKHCACDAGLQEGTLILREGPGITRKLFVLFCHFFFITPALDLSYECEVGF